MAFKFKQFAPRVPSTLVLHVYEEVHYRAVLEINEEISPHEVIVEVVTTQRDVHEPSGAQHSLRLHLRGPLQEKNMYVYGTSEILISMCTYDFSYRAKLFRKEKWILPPTQPEIHGMARVLGVDSNKIAPILKNQPNFSHIIGPLYIGDILTLERVPNLEFTHVLCVDSEIQPPWWVDKLKPTETTSMYNVVMKKTRVPISYPHGVRPSREAFLPELNLDFSEVDSLVKLDSKMESKPIEEKPLDKKLSAKKSSDKIPFNEKPLDEKPLDEKPLDIKSLDELPQGEAQPIYEVVQVTPNENENSKSLDSNNNNEIIPFDNVEIDVKSDLKIDEADKPDIPLLETSISIKNEVIEIPETITVEIGQPETIQPLIGQPDISQPKIEMPEVSHVEIVEKVSSPVGPNSPSKKLDSDKTEAIAPSFPLKKPGSTRLEGVVSKHVDTTKQEAVNLKTNDARLQSSHSTHKRKSTKKDDPKPQKSKSEEVKNPVLFKWIPYPSTSDKRLDECLIRDTVQWLNMCWYETNCILIVSTYGFLKSGMAALAFTYASNRARSFQDCYDMINCRRPIFYYHDAESTLKGIFRNPHLALGSKFDNSDM